MAKCDLTAARLKELVSYNADTGVFVWLSDGPKHKAGQRVGKADPSHGYWRITIDGELHYLHRLAWLYVYGVHPSGYIDHKNGDESDNRIDNLRDCSQTINMQNLRQPTRLSTSGLLGATLRHDTKRWTARIRANGKYMSLGCFDCAEDAHNAYIKAKRELHPGCTI